ncbi:c-type cytochrome [Micromonospora sp. NPDC049559]|uniref:cytochrome bc1 complex diheme cytochrome c subunit n=1 Tax=Micromonospora sp. NPDC049559 TaxID=3155923 RepID=UPI00342F40D5
MRVGQRRRYLRASVIPMILCLVAAPGPVLPVAAAPVPTPGATTTGPATTGAATTPGATTAGAATARPVGPDAGRGERLYLSSCASCHGPAGQGSQRGPSLVGAGPAAVDFYVGTGRMPLVLEADQAPRRAPVFSPDDIRALVRHVESFGGGGPPIPEVASGDLRDGRELFQANCAACHSATGAGAVLTNGWVAPSLDRATPVQVAEAIRVGPGLMPAFPETVLNRAQVDAVAGYVQELRGPRLDRGGASLGRLGPVTEGLVAWLVGLVLLVLAARWLGSRADR